jgi:hypothetical protein
LSDLRSSFLASAPFRVQHALLLVALRLCRRLLSLRVFH